MSAVHSHRSRWTSRSVASAEDQRRAMTQRSYAQSVQIRKKRKEERLLEKRRQQPATIVDLSSELQLFLQNPSASTLEPLTRESSFLQNLLESNTEPNLCQQLLHQLKFVMLQQHDADDSIRETVLTLLEMLVSTSRESSSEIMMYYGSMPTRWSDLVCRDEAGAGSPSWLGLLVECLPKYVKAGSIMAHVFQDSAQAQRLLIPAHWNELVTALPITAQLCSVVLQTDSVTPATVFLQSLTETHLVGLLNQPSTAIAAAWILEGLTHRESAAVSMLCEHSSTVVPNLLLHQLRSSKDPSLLLPLLRTIGNIVTACQGQYISLFLEPLTLILPDLLSSSVADEVLWVMGCFLIDVGLPHHVLTTSVAPLWIPHLLQMLSSSSRSFDIKREALSALWNLLSVPPDVPLDVRTAAQHQLDQLLQLHVWHISLLDALWPMTTVDHAETVVVALRILQRLVDVIPDCHRPLMESLDRLQAICDRHLPLASDLATNLMDQLQDNDDESDNETEIQGIQGCAGGDTFVFGLPSQERETMVVPPTVGSTPVPAGRGRGMTLPAWMAANHQQG